MSQKSWVRVIDAHADCDRMLTERFPLSFFEPTAEDGGGKAGLEIIYGVSRD